MSVEEQFAYITQRFIQALEKVECTQEEYLAGLMYALAELEVSIQAVKETM